MSAQPWSYEDMMVERLAKLRERCGWTEGSFGRVWWINSARPNVGRYPVLADSVEHALELYQKGFETDEVPVIEPGDWDAVARLANSGYGVVDPYEWEPHPDHPGCVRVRRCKQLGEVAEELCAYLGREHEENVEMPLSPFAGSVHVQWPSPNGSNRIVVFSVRGGSEGDWVRVEAQLSSGKTDLLLLSKTFGGRDESWLLARRVADLLGV